MRRATLCLSLLAMLAALGDATAKPHNTPAPPPAAPAPKGPPHAWLFGAWTGGLFPVLDGKLAEDCRTQSTVHFSRDLVSHSDLLGNTVEQTVVTARTTPTGAEFHFVPGGATAANGFGCEDPGVLHVARETNDKISFPRCVAYPYPLERCSR